MRVITFLYFLLLAYMVAALAFWGHSLDKQSTIIYEHEIANHNRKENILPKDTFQKEAEQIKERKNRRKAQYLGEGATFLIIILIGAGVVYTSIRSNDRLSKQQTNFILSITHELKSPIAAMKLNLETLSKRKLNESLQKKLIDGSIKEADRLDDLSNNLLLASQMEDRKFRPASEKIDFSKLLNEAVDVYDARFNNDFEKNIESNCHTLGDPLLWKLAINNILENSVKYGNNLKITTTLYSTEENLVIYIADEGIGIPDEEKLKIFKKFYRVENEKSRKTKGTGLGLYLTGRIIHQFRGAIVVRDNQPQGTVFEITFPKN